VLSALGSIDLPLGGVALDREAFGAFFIISWEGAIKGSRYLIVKFSESSRSCFGGTVNANLGRKRKTGRRVANWRLKSFR